MTGPAAGLVMVLAAFLLGAIPWGYIAGRIGGGIDLRQIGSGGTGATNVLRTLGKPASAAVLLLDIAKGVLPVLVAQYLGLPPWWVAATAVAAVAGHCWSPFIGFSGGKGMATGAGAIIALMPQALAILPVFAIVVWVTRYVSLGSMVASAVATLLAVVLAASGRLDWAYAVSTCAIAGIIIFRHRGNFDRLRNGTERRLGESVAV
jgi:acyl phosphate:glycerol-3-phosphate acyltransferase